MGIKREEIPNHFAIVNSLTVDLIEEYKDSIDMPVVIFKKQPFSTKPIENISNKANE